MGRVRMCTMLLAGGVILSMAPLAYGDYHNTGNPRPALAAGAEAQLQTAIQHARELAAGSAALGGIREHLQHTINCLEGSNGKNFKRAAGHPCEGMGRGFLVDASGKAGALFLARRADALAVEAVATLRDVPTAQAAARSVAFLLEEVRKLLK